MERFVNQSLLPYATTRALWPRIRQSYDSSAISGSILGGTENEDASV
jgi:hypothetical protein